MLTKQFIHLKILKHSSVHSFIAIKFIGYHQAKCKTVNITSGLLSLYSYQYYCSINCFSLKLFTQELLFKLFIYIIILLILSVLILFLKFIFLLIYFPFITNCFGKMPFTRRNTNENRNLIIKYTQMNYTQDF